MLISHEAPGWERGCHVKRMLVNHLDIYPGTLVQDPLKLTREFTLKLIVIIIKEERMMELGYYHIVT